LQPLPEQRGVRLSGMVRLSVVNISGHSYKARQRLIDHVLRLQITN
jgi:hypothetical protein